MANAITYKDLYLSLPGFLHIQDLEIREEPGKHSVMYIRAIMDSSLDEIAFYELPETISLNYILDNKEKILFKGVVSNAAQQSDGENRVLEIEVKDATYWMDLDRKNRCFQDTGITVQEVIAEIMRGYDVSDTLCNIPDVPIGELIFQYEETDWEFLNRFLSKYNDCIYPAATFETIHYQAGLSVQDETVSWDHLPCFKKKDFGRFTYLKQNGFPGLLSAQFTCCRIESYDVTALGSRIPFQGNTWYVAGLKRSLRNGLLVNSYELKQKEAMLVERCYNTRLTGISQYAIVTATQRDRVQAVMQGELLGNSSYWFPFSSVSSSSDGSGWYCMPEKGESVRIYFPTEKENDAYVITCIKGHAPGGAEDPMGNPAVRSISTASGELVQFNDDGILIAAKSGSAMVSLKDDGTVVVSAPAGIDLSPDIFCYVSAPRISCSASGLIKLEDDSGASITAGSAGMFLNGQEIYEN